MQVIVQLSLIAEFFPDEVPSVGGSVNQHIRRLLFQPSFYYSLKVFIFNLKIFKA